jgi:hypothetical protein
MGARSAGAVLAAMAMIASCAPRPVPPAPIAPPPRPAPPHVQPPPPPPPPPADWRDAPLSPGDWTYQSGAVHPQPSATFQSERIGLLLRCERNRTILIGVTAAQAPAFTIRTSYGERRLPATAGPSNEMLASLPAADPLFDQMAFSRGRLLVQPEGGGALIVPAWPEIARVTEDCRGP